MSKPANRTVEHLLHQLNRDNQHHQTHLQALHQELRRSEALRPVQLRILEQRAGIGIERLLDALTALSEASDPLRGAPTEDTMRVANPSSSRVEGSTTEWARRYTDHVRRRIDHLAGDIEAKLSGGYRQGAGLRCHRRACDLRGRRQHGPVCSECGGRLGR